MEIFKGSPAFPGIAIGKIRFYSREEQQILQHLTGNVKKELADFNETRNQVLSLLEDRLRKKEYETEQEEQDIREQINLLFSGKFIRAIEGIITNEKMNAAYAIMENRDEISETFARLTSPAIVKRIANIRKVSDLLVQELGGFKTRIDFGRNPVILLADNLLPSELLEMDTRKLLAIVTRQGSASSHTAIVTKTMEVPALMETEITPEMDGCDAIVDCYAGKLLLNPNEETLHEYKLRQSNGEKEWKELLSLRDKESVTLDGKKIDLLANIGNEHDLDKVHYYGAEGIGLLRSEFQYLGREEYPREKELYEVYKKIAETMGDKPLVIRTVDIGMDKKTDYMDFPQEVNPLMGNRGIRLCLDRRRMFRAQLRAIYRASAYGNLSVLYPMITSEEEMDQIEEVTNMVVQNLDDRGIPYKNIHTGIMVETPAAVMIAGELAKRVDFLALGTNDLTQYTLAMDRENPQLKNKYNDHHPAVLKMIQMTIESAHKEKRRVYICGELAADTKLTETFIQMGVDGLSVVPASILPVRNAIMESIYEKKE